MCDAKRQGRVVIPQAETQGGESARSFKIQEASKAAQQLFAYEAKMDHES